MTAAGVDVIVPCHNYGRYLQRCVASVLEETALPIRVLVIDDASSDDSHTVALRIAQEDSRVEVIRHPANLGHIATYNEGLDWVTAPYMLLLSADDLVAPGALARAVGLMEDHPDVGFVYGRTVHFRDEDELVATQGAVGGGAQIVLGADFIRNIALHPVNPVETASAVVRSRVQHRVGGYRPQFPHAGDLEMWLRFAAQANVGVVDAVQGLVRLHGANMRQGYLAERDARQRHEALSGFFRSHRSTLPGAARLERTARAGLAGELVDTALRAFDNGRPHAALAGLAREIRPSVVLTGAYLKYVAKAIVGALGRAPFRPMRAPPPAGARSYEAAPASVDPRPRPRLSLVISTRDRAEFLQPFLASLEKIATRQPWELIIVDNGSVDETWVLLARFASRAPTRIALVREPRPGLSHARNAGVRATAGEIVCFTDDDCYPRPDFVDSVLEVFEDADIGFMGGQILLHDPEDAPVCITTRTSRLLFASGEFITTGEIQGACMAFRREVFSDIGLFDTAFGAGGPLKGAEDCEMVARACFAGWNGGFFTEPVIYHHHRRRGEGAAKITWSYDYSRGAFFAKLLLRYPRYRYLILRHWHWVTPIFWRPSQRAFIKFWRELRGACRYALLYSWSAQGPAS